MGLFAWILRNRTLHRSNGSNQAMPAQKLSFLLSIHQRNRHQYEQHCSHFKSRKNWGWGLLKQMEAAWIGLLLSWWAVGGKDSALVWSIHAVVHVGAGVTGEQQTGEAGLWGKMLVSLKSMVKFPLALTAGFSTKTLQTC